MLIFVCVIVCYAQDGGIASFFGKAKTSVIKSLEEKEAERQNKTNLFGKIGNKLEDRVAAEFDGLEGSGSGDGRRRPSSRGRGSGSGGLNGGRSQSGERGRGGGRGQGEEGSGENRRQFGGEWLYMIKI